VHVRCSTADRFPSSFWRLQSPAVSASQARFRCYKHLVCSLRMEPTTRRSFEPAGAGGVLLGILLAAIALGALIGWAVGSPEIGALIGAVVGIPLAVYSVYRRYRDSF
jgi:hypothetical protein